jgi:hypothetical protein
MPTLSKNTLTPQVDLPTWEWTRFAPAVSAAISSTCSADNPNFLSTEHGRYIYYLLNSTNFFRYDTFTDVYQQLTQPPAALTTYSSMKLMGGMGPEGNVIAAGANTLTVPAVSAQAMLGYDVVIVSGPGAGQRRTITGVAEPTVHDTGVVTTVTNTQGSLSFTDTARAWGVNQYAGYTARIVSGTGVGQYRRILSNTATVLTFGDTTQQNKLYNNPGIFAPVPVITAGLQASFTIESQVLTLDSAWGVQPTDASVFRIQSGMISMVTSTAAAPFFVHQMYDILTDTWYIMPSSTNALLAAATDMSLERMSENASIWERGRATGGTTTTLIDATRGVDNPAWQVNQWQNYWVYIFSGTGVGQIRKIDSNTATTLTWSGTVTAPDTTSRYMILGFDAGTASAAAQPSTGPLTLGSLTDSAKTWAENRWKNYAVRILHGTGAGQVRTIASNTATALSIYGRWDVTPSTDSVYVIQGDPDKMFMWNGGNAAVPIMNLESTVTTLGRQVDWGIARSSSATVAGHQPVSIASATWTANVATVTTSHPHQFRVGGPQVTVAGITTTTALNGTFTIASVPSATTFTYALTGSGTPAIGTAQSVTTLVDVTKAWQTDEHAGRFLYVQTAATTTTSGAATTLIGRITANTATTLTIVGGGIGTAPTNGVSRYSICTAGGPGVLHAGVTSGGSTTTLVQSGANWPVNIYSGKRVRIFTTATTPIEVSISSNTADTLTVTTIGSPTTNVTGFQILEGVAKGAGCSANWAFGTTNADIRGRYMFATRGGGLAGFDRLDLTTDRMSPIATSPTTEVLTTGTMTAYDGENRIYFHVNGTQRVMSLNVVTANVNGGSMYPYVAPTAIIGNRMEIITTKDGLNYLWLNRASFAECFRCLLYW